MAFSQAGDDDRRIMGLNDQSVRGFAMLGSRVRSVGGLQRGRGASAVCFAVVVAATFGIAPATSAQCEYEVAIIRGPECPPFGYPSPAFGYGLNSYGHVVGSYWQCEEPAYDEAFLWTPETGMITLERPEEVLSAIALDINDDDVIVGQCVVDDLGFRGFVYDDGEWTILHPVVPDSGQCAAVGVNNAGLVVGSRSVGEAMTPLTAFIWSSTNEFTDLGLMGLGASEATDISESGEVTGTAGGLGFGEAYLWVDGKSRLLGVPPEATATGGNAVDTGRVVGPVLFDSESPRGSSGVGVAGLWYEDQWNVLGLPDDCVAGGATNISAPHFSVIGACTRPNGTTVPFIWRHAVFDDLNTLLVPERGIPADLNRVWEINEIGQIAGSGQAFDLVAMRLTPLDPPLGDLDFDCVVGVYDLQILLDSWRRTNTPADLNSDGVVNVWDLLILLSQWD